MRVLFSMMPMLGHLHPLVPLGQALLAQGHQVAFATAKSFAPRIHRAGFEHFSCGVDHDGTRLIFRTLEEQGHLAPKDRKGPHLFAELLAPLMMEDLPEICSRWRPDLIVHDPVELAGHLAAEMEGVPHVLFSWAFYFQPNTMKAWWGPGLSALRERYGLPPDPEAEALHRHLAIDYMPPSWHGPESPRPPVARAFSAPLFDRSQPGGLPSWVEELPDRPTVYATLGTALNHAPATFCAFIEALAGEDLDLIITVGPGMDPRQFDPLPENIHVEQYIPQTLLLPRCQAVIAHGGYNTLLSALWHGLPLVVNPLTAADQPVNGRRCAEVGAGVLVEGQPPDANELRRAVLAVLKKPGYRDRARAFQEEIKALPPLSMAVRLMEQLA